MRKKPTPSYRVSRQVAETCLCFSLQRASRAISRGFDEALRSTRLTNYQFSLLMALNRPRLLTIGELADELGTDRTTTTAALKPLLREDLITIHLDRVDARVKRVSLTSAGRERLSSALPHWRRANQTLLAKLDEDTLDGLRRGLEIVATARNMGSLPDIVDVHA